MQGKDAEREREEKTDRTLIRLAISIWVGWRWQQQQQAPDVPLHTDASQLLPGDPEAFPGQMRYVTPPASCGVCPEVSSQLGGPTNQTLESPRLALFKRGGAAVLLRAPRISSSLP